MLYSIAFCFMIQIEASSSDSGELKKCMSALKDKEDEIVELKNQLKTLQEELGKLKSKGPSPCINGNKFKLLFQRCMVKYSVFLI